MRLLIVEIFLDVMQDVVADLALAPDAYQLPALGLDRRLAQAPREFAIARGRRRNSEGALDFVDNLRSLSHLNLQGIYTHFPSADTDEALTLSQIKSFMGLIEDLEKRGTHFTYVHAANSVGFVGYKNIFFNQLFDDAVI